MVGAALYFSGRSVAGRIHADELADPAGRRLEESRSGMVLHGMGLERAARSKFLGQLLEGNVARGCGDGPPRTALGLHPASYPEHVAGRIAPRNQHLGIAGNLTKKKGSVRFS